MLIPQALILIAIELLTRPASWGAHDTTWDGRRHGIGEAAIGEDVRSRRYASASWEFAGRWRDLIRQLRQAERIVQTRHRVVTPLLCNALAIGFRDAVDGI